MGGEENHNHGPNHNHNHNHPPPPPPSVMAQPLGGAKGPVYPPAEQLLQLHYCIHSNPSWPQTVLLAFQHYIVMLGSVVMIASALVPLMGGNNGDKARVIQTMLFMAGINTLLQTLFGSRLPTVFGPSFAFTISVLLTINEINDRGYENSQRFSRTIRTVQGSLIVSAFLNIITGYGRAWGNLTRYFSPVVLVPVVCVVGLGLFVRGFPLLGNCVEIGLPTLILLIISQQYLLRIHSRTRPILERFALLLCVGFVWAFAAILTAAGAYNNVKQQTKISCRTDSSHLLQSAPWARVPYPFQWGAPLFSASQIFGMIGASLVSSAESTAAFYATSRLSGATIPPAHVVSRSIGLQGIGQLLDGIFGSLVGSSVSIENIGLLGITRVGSRRVVELSSAFMIFFAIFGKFGAFFASIPLPIFAGLYCVLYAVVAATGISFLQFANPNSMRNIYILGVSLFLGISIPQYFVMNIDPSTGHGPLRTPAGWFNNIVNTIFSSPPTVAITVGTILDNTLESHAHEERGIPWVRPFQKRNGDSRNEEFYSYPLRINEYMPTRFL